MKKYNHLIGKSKKEILDEMGNQFNHYPASTWTYQIKIDWLGRKKILVLYFDDHSVTHVSMISKW